MSPWQQNGNGRRSQVLWWRCQTASSLAILPYDEVLDLGRHPQTFLAFCESAYEAGARLAGWDTIAFTSSACPSPDDLQDLQATAAGQFGRAVAS